MTHQNLRDIVASYASDVPTSPWRYRGTFRMDELSWRDFEGGSVRGSARLAAYMYRTTDFTADQQPQTAGLAQVSARLNKSQERIP